MRHLRRILLVLTFALTALAGAAGAADTPPVAAAGAIERAAVASDGTPADASSTHAAISAEGRYVGFTSSATNLVDADTGGRDQVYVRDRASGTVELVSVGPDGAPVAGDAYNPELSADGRHVTFGANVAVTEDGAAYQVYLRDRQLRSTELVSSGTDGVADRSAVGGRMSADARYVEFESSATNLVPSAADNGFTDVFVKDRVTGALEHISVSSDGVPGDLFSLRGAISADGRYVAFQSWATNLDETVPVEGNLAHDVYLRDRVEGTTVRVSAATDGSRGTANSYCPTISDDGRYVAFTSASANLVPADGNMQWDVFVRDVVTERTERVSVAVSGREGQGDFFFRCAPVISGDGRYVAFQSVALDLVEADDNAAPDIFVHDRLTSTTEKAAVGPDGTQGQGSSTSPAISGDGRFVAFGTGAGNILPDEDPDDPSPFSVVVRDRGPALGIGAASLDDGAVTGWAGFAPNVVSQADGDPAGTAAYAAGADLLGAALAHRPYRQDLLVRWDLHLLPGARGLTGGLQGQPVTPGVAGAPGVVYGMDLSVDGRRYRIQAPAGVPAASFGLYSCELVCEEVAELRGGVGVAGEDVRVTVPLALLEAVPGAPVTEVRAWTALGSYAVAPVELDAVSLPDWVVPEARVVLGVADKELPPDEVAFTTAADLLPVGSFSAGVEVPDGKRLWGRACLAEQCGPPVPVGG